MSLIKDLLKDSNSILSIREDLGAQKHNVYFLVRTWSENVVGKGIPKDSVERMSPAPGLQEFPHDIEQRSGGKIMMGDIRLKMVSKLNYPREKLELRGSSKGEERFYYINKNLYAVAGIQEYHLHYDLTLRKTSNSKVYLDDSESRQIE